ncbi:MAG: GNAT family N-acetyltransferase [Actinomycetota bacterium]
MPSQPTLDDVLDNMPWHALTGPQAALAEGPGPALRYPRNVSIFCAAERLDREGWTALAEMVGPGRAVVLFQAEVGDVPPFFQELSRAPVLQMVADGVEPATLDASTDAEIVPLSPADAEEMVALTDLTRPGPFAAETHRLGTYLGIREEGRLIAMAGERLRTDQAAEISAVCTHPDARRRGLAAALTRAMMDEIEARGQLALLHVAEDNVGAIAVYEQLGFRVRKRVVGFAARAVEDLNDVVSR